MAPNQSLQAWLKSPDGPRFGRPGQPMKLEIQQFGWQLIKQLFALEDDKREGLVSGSLELLGQYYEQHRLKNPKLSGQPLLTARLSDLSLEGPGAVWSGLQLLMLAKKTALAENRELRLVGHSPAVLEVFELLNVAAYFGDHLVMDSP